MAASMGEVCIPRWGAKLPSSAVNSGILEAYVIPGYKKSPQIRKRRFGLLKGMRRLCFPPNRGGQVSLLRHSSLRLAAFLQFGKACSTHVLVTTFSFCKSKSNRTLGKGENLGATLYSPAKSRICHTAGTHSTAWHFHLAHTNFTPCCSTSVT